MKNAEIIQAGKYANARPAARPVQTSAPARPAPNIFVPTLTNTGGAMMQEWFWRELRDGGLLDTYIQRERARSPQRLRAVAKRMQRQGRRNLVRRRGTQGQHSRARVFPLAGRGPGLLGR